MKLLEPWEHDKHCKMGAANGSKTKNAAAKRGIAYHRKFYTHLREHFPQVYPDQKLLIEPWFRGCNTQRRRSPDAVIVDPLTNTGIVIEVKMNWKEGRDQKLLNEYLPIVKSAFGLAATWPLLVTQNVRGAKGKPLIWTPKMTPLEACLRWKPGADTPVALFLK